MQASKQASKQAKLLVIEKSQSNNEPDWCRGKGPLVRQTKEDQQEEHPMNVRVKYKLTLSEPLISFCENQNPTVLMCTRAHRLVIPL